MYTTGVIPSIHQPSNRKGTSMPLWFSASLHCLLPADCRGLRNTNKYKKSFHSLLVGASWLALKACPKEHLPGIQKQVCACSASFFGWVCMENSEIIWNKGPDVMVDPFCTAWTCCCIKIMFHTLKSDGCSESCINEQDCFSTKAWLLSHDPTAFVAKCLP